MPRSSPKRLALRIFLPHPITHPTWSACQPYLARRLLEGVFADPVGSNRTKSAEGVLDITNALDTWYNTVAG